MVATTRTIKKDGNIRVVYGEGGKDVGYKRPLKKRIESVIQGVDAAYERHVASKPKTKKGRTKKRRPPQSPKKKYQKHRSILRLV